MPTPGSPLKISWLTPSPTLKESFTFSMPTTIHAPYMAPATKTSKYENTQKLTLKPTKIESSTTPIAVHTTTI